MEDYLSLTDEQLHKLVISGNRDAEEALVCRCNRLVRSVARPYFLVGGDSEDLLQEGLIGLLTAIREFDAGTGIPFKSYAEICIKSRVLSAVRNATRKKHSPLNEGISLEDAFNQEESQAQVVSEFSSSAEEQVLAKESANEFLQSITQVLSAFERKVLSLFLDGYPYNDIAEKLGKSEKSVDNAVQRIRKKMAKIH